MPKKLTIEFIKQEFGKRNYKLIDTVYKNSRTKLNYICPNGHKHSIKWDHFRDGHGCPYCASRPPITIEFIKKEFEKEGYILLTKIYKNSRQKLEYICPNGHRHRIKWNNWTSGYRCPECAPNMKKTFGYVKKEIEKENYKLITKHYQNSRKKLHLICPKGHDYYVSWSNWKHYNSRCTECNKWGTSYQEKTLVSFIKTMCGDIETHDRKLISPYELDIVIPDKKLAIEYCGLYWHSELMGKDKNYHLNKLEACESQGYRLITIFEDEFVNNKEIIFSMLTNIIGLNRSKIIYARKCMLKKISSADAKEFCINNHIQGYAISSIRLGAFYNDELVSVMTFSKPFLTKRHKKSEIGIFELSRFCCKINTRVIGIFSKFIKYFERNYDYDEIFTYTDRRWYVGDVYKKVGFNFIRSTKPNYWYFKNNMIRMHRFGFRKTKDESKELSERQIRKSEGLNKIWDCGNLKYNLKK